MAKLIIDNKYVDFFKDEHVEVINSLDKIQELTGSFSEYTREFTVPATNNNNIIFKHYHDVDVVLPDGFNPYKSSPAILILEGLQDIEGIFELKGVNYINSVADSYVISFYGTMSSIKAQLDNINLTSVSDIDLSIFDFTYNYKNIIDSWTVKSKVLIPIQATELYYTYDINEIPIAGEYDPANIAAYPYATPVNHGGGVRWSHLKPTYNLKEMVRVILENVNYEDTNKYSVEWDSKIGTFLEDAYFGPSVQEGGIKDYQPAQSVKFKATRANWQYPAGGRWKTFDFDATEYDYANSFDTSNDKMTCLVDGSYSFDLWFKTVGPIHWCSMTVRLSIDRGGTIINHDTDSKWIDIRRRDEYRGFPHINLKAGDTVTWQLDFNPPPMGINWGIKNSILSVKTAPPVMQNITYTAYDFFPNITAYEFISSFLTTFNLLLLPIEEPTGTKLKIIDVDTYYNSGLANLKDWTKFIDVANVTSRKIEVPKRINLKFKKGEDFKNTDFYKKNGIEFGEFSFAMDTDFGKSEEKFESIFTIFNPDKMTWTDEGVGTNKPINVPMTYQFDEDKGRINTDFWLFFYSGLKECDRYWMQSGIGASGEDSFEDRITMPMTQSWKSNSHELRGKYSDRFMSYKNEYFAPYANEEPKTAPILANTIFENFHSDWIQRKYDKHTRKMVFNGNLPIAEFYNFKLNDRIIIDGKFYIIPEIKYNILTEKVQITAVTYDSNYELTKLNNINDTGIADVSVCRDQICRTPAYDAVSTKWLNSYNLKRDGKYIVSSLKEMVPYPIVYSTSGTGSGEGYHKYTIEIPAGTTPYIVGDVLAYYERAWRKADSSKEERTAQGVVIKIEGNKYTLIRFGDIEKTAHGYELNHWYWLKADGTYTKDKPSRLAQLLFYVYDENILQFNIEQPVLARDEKNGWIHIGEHPDVGWTITPTDIRHYFELKITDPHFDIHNVRNFTVEPGTNRVKVDFPVRPDEDVFVNITIMLSLNLNSASTRTIEVAHGVDGSVTSMADWYNQTYSGNPRETLDQNIPMTYNWSGIVKNDHTISIFLRASTADQITGIAKSIQVTGIV